MFIPQEERDAGSTHRERVTEGVPMKLSEAVREVGYGRKHSYEDCVLGRAYRKLTGRSLMRDGFDYGYGGGYVQTEMLANHYVAWAVKSLGVPMSVALKAEQMCFRDCSPADIADFVAAQGY